MKQRRKTNHIQTELFCEPRLIRGPNPLLPADRQAELKTAVAELLLNVAIEDAEGAKDDA